MHDDLIDPLARVYASAYAANGPIPKTDYERRISAGYACEHFAKTVGEIGRAMQGQPA